MILKHMIGDKEYSFRMTNRTIRKIDEVYGNYASIIYGIMEGYQFYTNALKLASMCCINKEKDKDGEEHIKTFTIEELEDTLTPMQYQSIAKLATNLYYNYMGIKEKKPDEGQEESEESEKN